MIHAFFEHLHHDAFKQASGVDAKGSGCGKDRFDSSSHAATNLGNVSQ